MGFFGLTGGGSPSGSAIVVFVLSVSNVPLSSRGIIRKVRLPTEYTRLAAWKHCTHWCAFIKHIGDNSLSECLELSVLLSVCVGV